MSSIPTIPSLPKLNLSPQARAKLSVLTFLLGTTTEGVIDSAMEALIDKLSDKDKHLVPLLESRYIPDDADPKPPTGRLADQLRDFVEAEYVRPARNKGEKKLTVQVKEVHRRLGLVQRYPAVVSALQAKVFLEDCKLRLVESSGAKQGSTRVLVFELL